MRALRRDQLELIAPYALPDQPSAQVLERKLPSGSCSARVSSALRVACPAVVSVETIRASGTLRVRITTSGIARWLAIVAGVRCVDIDMVPGPWPPRDGFLGRGFFGPHEFMSRPRHSARPPGRVGARGSLKKPRKNMSAPLYLPETREATVG